MSKQMFLLEVWSDRVFKRRISESISAIEDWIDANAQKWVTVPVEVYHDGDGGGTIHFKGDRSCVFYKFSSTNIAVV